MENNIQINLASAFNALSPDQLGDFKFLLDKIEAYEQKQKEEKKCNCLGCRLDNMLNQIVEDLENNQQEINEETINIKFMALNPEDLFGIPKFK